MIYTKGNLEVVRVASKEPGDRGLHGVQFDADGATAATNGAVLMAVGPAGAGARWPEGVCDQMEPGVPGGSGVLLEPGLIEKVLSALAKQKGIQGAAMSRVKDPARFGFTVVNAKMDPTTVAGLPKVDRFPDWRAVVRKVRGQSEVKACVNRRDLINLLQAMEAAAPDKAGQNPVFLEVGPGGLVARCKNFETGQHCVGSVSAYDTRGNWLVSDAWERVALSTPVKQRVLPVRKGG